MVKYRKKIPKMKPSSRVWLRAKICARGQDLLWAEYFLLKKCWKSKRKALKRSRKKVHQLLFTSLRSSACLRLQKAPKNDDFAL